MPILSLLSMFSTWIARMQCEWREARRVRREMRELAAMSPRELADIGLSHASMANASRDTCCA